MRGDGPWVGTRGQLTHTTDTMVDPESTPTRSSLPGVRSVEAQDSRHGLVDAPELLGAQVTRQLTKPRCVHGAELFDENASPVPAKIDLWSKRRLFRADGRRSDDHHRAREKFVGLDDDPVSVAVLLVSGALGDLETVDVTAQHEAPP